MKARKRLVPLLMAALVCVPLTLGGQSPANAGSTGAWTRISSQDLSNINEAALIRTGDGILHAFWIRTDNGKTDLMQDKILANGTALAKSTIENDWSGMSDPDVVAEPGGGMRLFFGGIRTGSGDPNQNLNTTVSDQAGDTWTLFNGTVAEADSAYAAEMGAGNALDGTHFISWGGTHLHRGLNPADPNYNYATTVSNLCCSYEPDIGTDGVTGDMFVAWASNTDDAPGIWAHQIDLATGAPSGDPMLMPRVLTTFNGSPSYIQELSRVPITGRIGAPGVYIAYHGGYPEPHKILLWRIGDDDSTVLKNADGARFDHLALAPDSNGRLWIFWVREVNNKPRIWARRSNKTATQFGATSWISTPTGAETAWQLVGNAQDNKLDVVALMTTGGGTALYHSQILPALTITASPTSFSGKHEVKFTVLDAGDPVQGATVSIGGKSKATNGDGVAKITLGPYDHKKTLTATATKNSYQSNTVNVTAKP